MVDVDVGAHQIDRGSGHGPALLVHHAAPDGELAGHERVGVLEGTQHALEAGLLVAGQFHLLLRVVPEVVVHSEKLSPFLPDRSGQFVHVPAPGRESDLVLLPVVGDHCLGHELPGSGGSGGQPHGFGDVQRKPPAD